MRAKEVFAAALKATGLSHVKVSKLSGMPEQSIGQKINVRESIRADEFFDLLDVMGVGVVFFVKETGEALLKETQHGKRVVGMSDGIIYDTKESQIVASSFFADGSNEYGTDGKAQELYIDKEGRYFVAEYCNDGTTKDRVRSVPANMAEAFLAKYGISKDDITV